MPELALKMSGLPKKEECVRVVVRCRPMSSKEKDDGRQKVVEMDKKRGSVRARCLWHAVFTPLTTRACGVAVARRECS